MSLVRCLRPLTVDCAASTAIGYAVLAAIVAIVAIGGLQAFCDSAVGLYDFIITTIGSALTES